VLLYIIQHIMLRFIKTIEAILSIHSILKLLKNVPQQFPRRLIHRVI
jgi:hypothetical protein